MAKSAKKATEHAEKLQDKVNTHFVESLVLSIDGLSEKSTVASIKDLFNKYGDVGYVVYVRGQSKAEIRFFGEENAEQEAWNKL
ncbi:hypothetical protein Aduo_015723 [Ancylostoma duodenale]